MKADGLAAGKGVVVTSDREQAAEHARACGRVVIEEFLDGPEVSVFALADGRAAVPLLPAQDYKRAPRRRRGPEHRRHGRLRAAALGAAPGWPTRSWTRSIGPALDELRRPRHALRRAAVRRACA